MTLIAIHSIARFKPSQRINGGVQFGLHEVGTTLITNDLLDSFRKIAVFRAPIILGHLSTSVSSLRMAFPVFRPSRFCRFFAISCRRTAVNFSPACLSAQPAQMDSVGILNCFFGIVSLNLNLLSSTKQDSA